jgi:poly(A) polymerase
LPAFNEHLALHRLDCLSSHGDLTNYQFAKEKLEEAPEETLRPAPLITGHDLIAEGFAPGPKFSEILAAVEDAQLEGTLSNRAEAMAFAKENFTEAGDEGLRNRGKSSNHG